MAISRSSMASLVLMASFLVIFIASPSLCGAQRLGAPAPIPNLKSDMEVQDLGRFCVEEYNRKQGAKIVFAEVVSGQRQVVAGLKYYLRIKAIDAGATKFFDAVLWVRAWLGSKELLSFQPAA